MSTLIALSADWLQLAPAVCEPRECPTMTRFRHSRRPTWVFQLVAQEILSHPSRRHSTETLRGSALDPSQNVEADGAGTVSIEIPSH